MTTEKMTARELKRFYADSTFKKNYIYDGHDLGVSCGGDGTVFKLWSPTAERVELHLYPDGGESGCMRSVSMEQGEQGVWLYRTEENLHGTYYDYDVTSGGETRRTADPYAKACGTNGRRSMAVELERTDPEGWKADQAPERQREDIIYEIHVKEFSWDESAGFPEELRGTYRAFTEEDTTLSGDGVHPTGIRYLKELGVTHIQLMPVYDFGSVDEAGDREQFNWGYDPVFYNVPEGSYSSDPSRGEVRITELKELVQALHRNGFRVIMDVVYNHTYSADSPFQRVAPWYYYRQNEDGTLSDGSGCGNDFAAEREMAASFILDSVLYWTEEYHMDGFRFDLMGLLPTELMNRIGRALDLRYGAGEKLIYGEPWAADRTPMEPGFHQALKDQEKRLDPRVAMFCDNTRDAIKGHVFDALQPGFVNGGEGLEREILHAVSAWCDRGGAFRAGSPERILSYVSAHDNLTLWDKLILSMTGRCGRNVFYERPEEVIRAYKLAASIYFTCQGHLFFLSGEEFARTKEGNDNSFCAPISLNRLDYNRAYQLEDLVQFYKDLITLRKCLPGLCDKSAEAGKRIFRKNAGRKGVVSFQVDNRCKEEETGNGKQDTGSGGLCDTLFIAYNSRRRPVKMALPAGEWEAFLKDGDSGMWRRPQRETYSGIFMVPPVSAVIMGKKREIMQEAER